MSRQPSLGREYAIYFTIRLAVFGVVLALLLGLGMRGFVALVVSGPLSYPLARAQRRRVIDTVEARARRRRQGSRRPGHRAGRRPDRRGLTGSPRP